MKYLNESFTKENVKVFCIVLALSIIYVFPIIFADQYYSDDLSRSIYGYARWGYDGRPLADFVMFIVSFGYPLLDISPAPLILGLICISASLSVYSSNIIPESGTKEKVVLSILFICNPFLLDNMSYKYDALTMLLSASLIILCFSQRNNLKVGLLSVALLIASLSLYQASVTMFVSLSVIEAVRSFYSKEEETVKVYKNVICRAMQFMVAYLIYSMVVASRFAKGHHNEKHSELILGKADALPRLLNNINEFNGLVKLYIESVPKIVVATFFISMIFSILFICYKISKNKKPAFLGKVVPIVLVLASPLLLYFLSFIHLAMLRNTILAGRVLIPFGCFFIMYGIYVSEIKKLRYIPFIFVAFSFCLSFSYGNTMKAQKRYDDYLANSIMTDISYLKNKPNRMSVYGTIAKSKQLTLAEKKIPIIKFLVPLYINNDSGWGGTMLLHYGLNIKYLPATKEEKLATCNIEPEIKRPDYSVYLIGSKAVFRQNGIGC